MGIPLEDAAWMLGDNQYIITSSTIPQSMLGKQHNAQNYHCVQSAVAHGILKFVMFQQIKTLLIFYPKTLDFEA